MPIDRPHTPKTADERETLTGFLDHYRATLAQKCDGLTAQQLAERAVPPSELSLLGLIRHMGEVEKTWFRRFNGERIEYRYCTDEEPNAEFDNAAGDPDQVRGAYDYWTSEVEHAREVVGAHALDATFVHDHSKTTHSLRWILVHMIEEYARHCGHADLLRERIDGETGY